MEKTPFNEGYDQAIRETKALTDTLLDRNVELRRENERLKEDIKRFEAWLGITGEKYLG